MVEFLIIENRSYSPISLVKVPEFLFFKSKNLSKSDAFFLKSALKSLKIDGN